MFPFVIRHFGLAAAITLAQAGRSVQVIEAKETIGGGCRSMELTLPGFIHDVCSTIHPFAIFSPFFRTLPLEQYGLHWVHPDAEIAHPFGNGSAALLYRSVEATGTTFDRAADARTYDKLMKPLADSWDSIADSLLGPLAPLRLLKLLRHPFAHLRFGVNAFPSIGGLAEKKFKGKYAPALLAGIAAHSALPLEQPATAAFGLVLGILGHVVGWPFPRGGSRKIADALAAYFSSLGGEMVTGLQVESLNDLPSAHLYLCDLTPRQLLRIAGKRLPSRYQHKLERYRYGQGVCKLDFALAGPIPWKARECMRAATVHVGGTLEEIAASERAVWQGEHSERPFLILAQHSLFDATRAPAGKHTAWTYCHVPSGSTVDMTERIVAQIERFAPGFRDLILARSVKTAMQMEQYNANYVGGDINGGVEDWRQLLTRPMAKLVPYKQGLTVCWLSSAQQECNTRDEE